MRSVKICIAALIALLSTGWVTSAYGQSAGRIILNPTEVVGPSAGFTGIEGSWRVTMNLASSALGPSRFDALRTYDVGGGLVQTDAAPPNLFTASSSSGHGAWQLLGNLHTLTMVKFRFDVAGNLIGTTKITETLTLTATQDQYSGAGKFDILDLNGNLLFSTNFTSQATRLVAQLPQ
jgi:hypothetical protein